MKRQVNYEVVGINPKFPKVKRIIGGNFKHKEDAQAMRVSMKAVGFVRTYVKKTFM